MPNRPGGRFPILTRWRIYLQQTGAIIEADMRKLRHDPYELFTRMIQPAIWLLIFGQAMAHAKVIPTREASYLDFLAPGILAQSVLFLAIFFGIALIWERDMGILHKILITPTPRSLLVIGRSIAAGIRSLSQVFIIYFLSYLLGIHLRLELSAILLLLAMVLLGGAAFSTLSLIVACIVKKRERFMGIGQVLTMPLFFASNALYPIDLMPDWLKTLSSFNPLTYQVDALRSLMIVGETSHFGLGLDFFVLFLTYSVLVAIAAHFYPKILY
ncbi:MAG: ABC transporter permease [Parachlamydia sp.]|nr:ABC transporter permease [Parachlamydia sp.]